MSVTLDRPPPPTAIEDHGGEGGWVRLVEAENDIDAHLVVGRLNEAGIETRTIKDRNVPGAWLYGGANPWAPATVYVRKLDLSDARIVLADVAYHDTPARDPGSSRASSGPRWRTPLVWWVTALVLGVIFTGLALGQVSRWTGTCEIPILCGHNDR